MAARIRRFLGASSYLHFERRLSFRRTLWSISASFREKLPLVFHSGFPATPTATNPNFQTLLVTGSFTRNDGTIANVGDTVG